jgi:hypothetical protein
MCTVERKENQSQMFNRNNLTMMMVDVHGKKIKIKEVMNWKLWPIFSVRKFEIDNLNNIVYYPLTFLSPVYSFYEALHAFVCSRNLQLFGIFDNQDT